MNLNYLALALFFGLGQDDEMKPKLRFARCDQTNHHVSVQLRTDTYLVHFHVLVENCKGKDVYARLWCGKKVKGDIDNQCHDIKEAKIHENRELWSFYLIAPMLNEGSYQIELGHKDIQQIDEYQLSESFAWIFKNGRMFAGTKDEPIRIRVTKRVPVIKGESFSIRVVVEEALSSSSLSYGIVNTLNGPQDKNWVKKQKLD
jgi:hypothetical protein